MYEEIIRVFIMKKILIISIFSTLCLFSTAKESRASENFTDQSQTEWGQRGNFSEFLENVEGCDIERAVSLKPKNPKNTQIKGVFIGAYEGNITQIEVTLHEKHNKIKDELKAAKLGKPSFPHYNHFWSKPEADLGQFLNVFVVQKIMAGDLAAHILSLIHVDIDQDKALWARRKKEKNQLRITEGPVRIVAFNTKHPQNFSSFSINKQNTYGLWQHEYMVTTPTSNFPIISTSGAGPCVIAVFFNTQTGTTSLGHLDDLTTITGSLSQMIYAVGGYGTNVEMHLVGGDSSSLSMQLDILDWAERSEITLKSCKLNTNTNDQLAIDSRTGEISSSFLMTQITVHKDWEKLFEIRGIQFRKSLLRKAVL